MSMMVRIVNSSQREIGIFVFIFIFVLVFGRGIRVLERRASERALVISLIFVSTVELG